jgi:Tol biopolymer transport system component
VATPPEKLLEVSELSPFVDIAPDSRSVLLQSLVENEWVVLRVPLDSARSLHRFSESKSFTAVPRFSPDGRWVALLTNESDAFEVYIRSYPEPTVKLQVSVGGGDAPVWGADGKRLYYCSNGAIVEARLATTPVMRVVSRDTAFRRARGCDGFFGESNYDISRDGSRMLLPVPQSVSFGLIVVPNWLTEFQQRLAASRRK